MNDVVSIIVPVYNSEKTIAKCIGSLCNQTYKDVEILIVDDGSTDFSVSKIEDLTKGDNRVRIVSKANGGVSSARNAGLLQATGKYIMFVDSDDYCETDTVQNLVSFAEKYSIDLVSCSVLKEDCNGLHIATWGTNTFVEECFDKCGMLFEKVNASYVFAKLYKRIIIETNGIRFDESISICEDAIFVHTYLCNCTNGLCNTGATLYHYVDVNGNSLSKKYVENIEVIYSRLYDIDSHLMKKCESYYIPFPKECLMCLMAIINMYTLNSPLSKKERVKKIANYIRDKEIYSAMKKYRPPHQKEKIIRLLYLFRMTTLLDLVLSIFGKYK